MPVGSDYGRQQPAAARRSADVSARQDQSIHNDLNRSRIIKAHALRCLCVARRRREMQHSTHVGALRPLDPRTWCRPAAVFEMTHHRESSHTIVVYRRCVRSARGSCTGEAAGGAGPGAAAVPRCVGPLPARWRRHARAQCPLHVCSLVGMHHVRARASPRRASAAAATRAAERVQRREQR